MSRKKKKKKKKEIRMYDFRLGTNDTTSIPNFMKIHPVILELLLHEYRQTLRVMSSWAMSHQGN
jgi:hypothetical protein